MRESLIAALVVILLICSVFPALAEDKAAADKLAEVKSAAQEPTKEKPAEETLFEQQVIFIPISGVIYDSTVAFVQKKIDERRKIAKVVVLDLDTPGGLVRAAEATAKIVEANRQLRFIAFISGAEHSGAWSAGAFMAFCCQEIYMSPGKAIGAAMVITTEGGITRRAKPKFESLFATRMRAIAQRNGHSSAVAQAMTLAETELWRVKSGDKSQIVTGMQYEALPAAEKKGAEQIKRMGTILSLTDKEAE